MPSACGKGTTPIVTTSTLTEITTLPEEVTIVAVSK